jgi:hypothetical protein
MKYRIYLCLRNALNLNHCSVSRGNCLQAGPRRHGLWQEIDVHLVHRGEVLHVRKVYVVFDNLLERRA